SYYPANNGLDGTFRRVRVEVNGKNRNKTDCSYKARILCRQENVTWSLYHSCPDWRLGSCTGSDVTGGDVRIPPVEIATSWCPLSGMCVASAASQAGPAKAVVPPPTFCLRSPTATGPLPSPKPSAACLNESDASWDYFPARLMRPSAGPSRRCLFAKMFAP